MRLAVVGAIVLMLGSMAMAEDTPYAIDYEIRIGGINYEEDFKEESYKAFVPGTTTPAPVIYDDQDPESSIITWDVSAAASGTTGTWTIQGIANLTFDIELQDENGDPVPVKFFSTINDGNSDSTRAQMSGMPEPFERAAFCMGWDVNMDYTGGLDGIFVEGGSSATGRLNDPVTSAGPNMDRVQFPSTSYHGGGRMKGSAYFADCNGDLIEDSTQLNSSTDTDDNGILDECENGLVSLPGTTGHPLSAAKLSGMGVGYSQFGYYTHNLGVGLAVESVLPVWYTWDEMVGIGIKPVAEGQIDLISLPTGTYKLVLTASEDANNVVPTSYSFTPGGFAVKVDEVYGAEVEFFWDRGDPPIEPAVPTAWKSVRTHGAVELAIDLDPADDKATSETRSGGIQKLVISFSGGAPVLASPAVNIGVSPAMTVTSQTVVGNDLIVTFNGSTDETCYTFDLTGVLSNLGGAAAAADCKVAALLGDANDDKSVDLIDMAQVKSKNGKDLLPDNVRFDLNTDGSIDLIDMALCKSRNGKHVTCP